MSGETNIFSPRNEVTYADDSMRGTSKGFSTSNGIENSEPSSTPTRVDLKPQYTSTPKTEPPTSEHRSSTALPMTTWPMFLEKYSKQTRIVSRRLQFSPPSNVDDQQALVQSSFRKSTGVKTGPMTSNLLETVTVAKTKWLSKNEYVPIQQKLNAMKDEPSTSTESYNKKVDKESMKRQPHVSTRRHELKCTITAPLQKKILPEEAESPSIQVNSITTASSLHSSNCLPKKRHRLFSSNPPVEFFKKNGKWFENYLN